MQVATALNASNITAVKVYDHWMKPIMDKKTKINIRLYSKLGVLLKIKQDGLE